MDTARQVIRWALPGWLGIVFWIIFVLVIKILNIIFEPNVNEKIINFAIINDFFNNLKGLFILLGVAAIPIGFLIYQIYYYIYWRFPIPSCFKFLISSGDRGSEILEPFKDKIDFNKLFGRNLYTKFKSPYCRFFRSLRIMKSYQENWTLSESVWYEALSNKKYKFTGQYLEKRSQFLSDMFHCLGACNVSLIIAFCIFLITHGIISISTYRMGFILLSIGIYFIIVYFLFTTFRRGRNDSFNALKFLRCDIITNALING